MNNFVTDYDTMYFVTDYGEMYYDNGVIVLKSWDDIYVFILFLWIENG